MSLYSLNSRLEGTSLKELPSYESHLGEGEEAELHVLLSRPLKQEELDLLDAELRGKGVSLLEPVYQYLDPPELVIHARKEQPFLGIVALVLLALAGGIALYWFIFRPKIAPRWDWVAGGMAMGVTGAGLAYYGFEKRKTPLGLAGVGLVGGGTYLAVREFMPKPKVKKRFSNLHTKYSSPTEEGEWVKTGDFK